MDADTDREEGGTLPVHFEDVLLTRHDAVATVTLNRPDHRNAWTLSMGAEVEEALAFCNTDPQVRAVVLTGAGECFCVGADLSGHDILAPGGEHERPRRPRLMPPDMSKPVIAAINGHAIGIGTTFPMQCDVRIVAEDAKVGLPFVRRGVIAEASGHWILPRLIGFAAAAELLLTGRLVSGAEAAALGLCSQAVPKEEVVPTAYSIAEEIATFASPLAVAATKKLMWEALETTRSGAAAREQHLFTWLAHQPDAEEGVLSFLEHRAPRWIARREIALPDLDEDRGVDR